jgi:amino acid transporter
VTIIGLIITGVIISAGGGPNHEAIGFKYWNETGGFTQYEGIGKRISQFAAFTGIIAAFTGI